MSSQDHIIIRGLRQNNLKNVSLDIPKGKIVVFTGVSGSGKSSIVFDTIAAESQWQMNETYTAFMRGRLPKYEKPKVERIDNLSASVIVDQSRLGGNARSTVGTISDMYAALRLLYSRIGQPYAGTASYFSFNDPNGMCPECSGRRLNAKSLACKVAGYSIDEMCAMEFTELVKLLRTITDSRVQTVVDALTASLERMTGLLQSLRDRGNTVLVGLNRRIPSQQNI